MHFLLLCLSLSIVLGRPADLVASGSPPTRAEIYGRFHELVKSYSGWAFAERVGESWRSQGAAPTSENGIWAFRLGRSTAASSRSLVLLGGQHAREISGPVVLFRLAERLLGELGSDPLVTSILESQQIWIVPLMNPDGYDQVVDGRSDWRKNANPTQNRPSDAVATLPDGIGVDLNRNFPLGWGLATPPDRDGTGWHGASDNPADFDYQGPAPGSEPETQAMMAFLNRVQPEVFITYHAPLAMVIWPWGHRSRPTDQDRTLSAIGRRMAKTYGYLAGQTFHEVGFTTGDIADWVYDSLATLAFGVEFDGGFAPDNSVIQRLADQTYETIRYVAPGLAEPAAWVGPRVTDLRFAASANKTGIRAQITATIEASVPTGDDRVGSAELSLGPFMEKGSTIALNPADGAFDSGEESAVASLDLPPGRHEIWIRGRTATGQPGVQNAVVVSVLPFRSWVPIALLR